MKLWEPVLWLGRETYIYGEMSSMLGSNVPTVGGLPIGFKYAQKWGCDCIQIYVSLSRRWDVPALSEEDVSDFKTAWQASNVKQVVAHVPFLVNLASPDDDIRKKSKERLGIEISRAVKLGVGYLAMHPGSSCHSSKTTGMRRIIGGLNSVLENIGDSCPKVLLETMAGQGNVIGSSFEDIAFILEHLERPNLVGVCLDTAHVFMAGYDIRGYEGYESVLNEFEQVVGVRNINAIHLNDSKTELGSRKDLHAHIGEGELGLEFFHAILRDARFSYTPKVLETPERDTRSEDNLKKLRYLRDNFDAILAPDVMKWLRGVLT